MLDHWQTLKAYRARLRGLPAGLFSKWFDGKWISSFTIRSTIATGRHIGPRFTAQYPTQAYLVAIEKGATPLGITTEHKRAGVYVCPHRQTIPESHIRYIGKYSHFSGHRLRKEDNPFSVQSSDKRYTKIRDPPLCLSYNLRSGSIDSHGDEAAPAAV